MRRLSVAWTLFAVLALALFAGAAPAVAQDKEEEPRERSLMEDPVEGEEPAVPGDPLETAEEPPAPAEPLVFDRITFEIPFPAEKGGGTATGSANHLEYLRDDYVVTTGGVEFKYQDMKFQGNRVEVDLTERTVLAEGDVILDQGPRRIVADTLTFDLDTETGEFTNGKAFVDPDIYFEGEKLAKIGEDVYTVTKGKMTSCEANSPAWSFKLSKARIRMEGFARVTNARFRVKKLPILYTPYFLYPAKSERASGLLFPNLGFSRARGEFLGLAYFKTLGPSYDTTFFVDLYSDEFFGFGNEIRYRPTQSTQGIFEGYVVDDPIEDRLRWRVAWDHASNNLPLGFRGAVRYSDFSDLNFFRDFERDFDRSTLRRLQSTGYVQGSWGQQSFTLLLDQSETFLTADDKITLRQLPEAEYRLRATQLGKLPIYLDLLGSLHYFSVERTETFSEEYGRADVFPQLTAALSTLPWLSVSVSAGERVTWYSDSNNEERTGFSGESLTRTFTTASSNIVGPSFSRVFDKKIGRFARFKHIFEPRWGWFFVDDFDMQDQVPLFDQVDRLRSQHLFSYAFVNRLLAKPEDEEEYGGAREIMSFEVNQFFSLDNTQPVQFSRDRMQSTTRGPISGRFRFNPTARVSLESQVSYNTLFSRLNSTSLSGGLRLNRYSIGATWFTRLNPETGDTTGNQVRLFTGFEVWPSRFRVDSQVNYDFQTSLLQSQRHIFQYTAQCWGLRLELREQRFANLDRRDRDFRFALTLKNIGTFLDLTGGTRNGLQPGIGFNDYF